jgi:hypothetical protein
MNPFGHMVSLTSSTVTSWRFSVSDSASVGVGLGVAAVAVDAREETRVEKGASERPRRDASVAVATRLAAAAAAIRSVVRSGRRPSRRASRRSSRASRSLAAAAAARLLLRDGLVHVLVRVTGRERESVHGLAESDDDLMDDASDVEGRTSRGSWFSSVDGRDGRTDGGTGGIDGETRAGTARETAARSVDAHLVRGDLRALDRGDGFDDRLLEGTGRGEGAAARETTTRAECAE